MKSPGGTAALPVSEPHWGPGASPVPCLGHHLERSQRREGSPLPEKALTDYLRSPGREKGGWERLGPQLIRSGSWWTSRGSRVLTMPLFTQIT